MPSAVNIIKLHATEAGRCSCVADEYNEQVLNIFVIAVVAVVTVASAP